jgi:hypothetical protein
MVAKLLFLCLGKLTNAIKCRIHETWLLTHVPKVVGELLQLQVHAYRTCRFVELEWSEAWCQPPPPLFHVAIPHLNKPCGTCTCPNEAKLVLVERGDQCGSASMLSSSMRSLQMQLIPKKTFRAPETALFECTSWYECHSHGWFHARWTLRTTMYN